MDFKEFKRMFQNNFATLTKDVTRLFEVELDKDKLWDIYLNSFPEGTNNIYRVRTDHDCSCCRHFIKNIGNVVVIKDNTVTSIWDFTTGDSTYQPVIDALSSFVKSHLVSDVYFSKFDKVGTDSNYEELVDGKVIKWEHFYLKLPTKFVDSSDKSLGEIKGSYRDTRNVFRRSLDEISKDSVVTVLELISQNSLYKGEEWKTQLNEFLKYKNAYDLLTSEEAKHNFAWEKSVKAGAVIGKIKNHSIGVLLTNISDGMDLDEAVRKYEAIVAPSNYKRPKAIFTKKMLEEAKNNIESLGYLDSLGRRYATIDDITVNNILFSNKDVAKKLSGNVFDDMLNETVVNSKKFSKVEEVAIDKFVKDVLPLAKEVEVLFENRHESSLVSLIAPKIKESKTMFKWDNGFSWSYAGNITDSMLKDRVKSAGGKVDGVLRFSIQWNDIDSKDDSDLDAHCVTPKHHIYFSTPKDYTTGGELDVDIQFPSGKVAVENITWPNKNKMVDGNYLFQVHNFNNRGNKHGFRAEIEFDGQQYSFDYSKPIKQGETINVATVALKNGMFSIKEELPSSISSREFWSINTNQFVPVSTVMYSPNYWDEQQGIGHKHYFFMLKGCINPECPNGFYNEFLKQELVQHKRVFEALGSKMSVEPSENQLSGLGFSSTKRNDLIVKVKGSTERVLKIKF